MKIFCGIQSGSFLNNNGEEKSFCKAYICDSLNTFTLKDGRKFNGYGVRAEVTTKKVNGQDVTNPTAFRVKSPEVFSGVPFGAEIGWSSDEYGRINSVTVKNPYPFFSAQDAETCLELLTSENGLYK